LSAGSGRFGVQATAGFVVEWVGSRAFRATPQAENGPAFAGQELLASLCPARAGCRFGLCGVASSIPAAGGIKTKNRFKISFVFFQKCKRKMEP